LIKYVKEITDFTGTLATVFFQKLLKLQVNVSGECFIVLYISDTHSYIKKILFRNVSGWNFNSRISEMEALTSPNSQSTTQLELPSDLQFWITRSKAFFFKCGPCIYGNTLGPSDKMSEQRSE